MVTGSSDYHGLGKVDHELGCNTTDPEEYAAAPGARGGRVRPVRAGHPAGRELTRYFRPSDWNRWSTPPGTTRATVVIALYCAEGIENVLPFA